MISVLYLAWRHLWFQRLRSATLTLVFAILVGIPLLSETLVQELDDQMMARAEATPLVYGAAGAPLELTLSAAYFRGAVEAHVAMADYEWLVASRLAALAPIHLAGTVRGAPVVGTDIEYFALRGLTAVEGRLPARIGEVAMGADAAERLSARVGDVIASDIAQVFDLAGAHPIGLVVTGVLARSGSADDDAILTDLRTGWIVSGLGHGHQDLNEETDRALRLEQAEGPVTANASLPTIEVISPDQLDRFHFHGDPATFPLSSVLVFPHDARAAALLQGRVADLGRAVQILRPSEQIRGLMDDVLRVKTLLQRVMAAIGGAALLSMGLVVWLSVQMRRREFDIAHRLGADPALPVALVAAELLILLIAACALALLLVWGASSLEDEFSQAVILRS